MREWLTTILASWISWLEADLRLVKLDEVPQQERVSTFIHSSSNLTDENAHGTLASSQARRAAA